MKLLLAFLITALTAAKGLAQMKTIEDRVAEFGEPVRARLAPQFEAAGVLYPPTRVTLLGIKQDRVLEVHAAGPEGALRFICAYPILAASGQLGPKLKEGDRQVPEGIYRIRELNPNSLFHLALWIDYPNEFDWARAAEDGRTEPGSEIMIHGSDRSLGCLAMGDPAAEDLFVLAALVGTEQVRLVIAPVDLRRRSFAPPEGTPSWTAQLYDEIQTALNSLVPDEAQ